jgi:cyclopropane fatty-acyl-phospholipid synthase-like methyltransferase
MHLERTGMNPYRWNARDYAKHSSAQHAWGRELIAKLNLHGFEHVLDVGCGDGKVTAIGQEKKGDLRGVFVHKFKIQTIQYLLSCRFVGDALELIITCIR